MKYLDNLAENLHNEYEEKWFLLPKEKERGIEKIEEFFNSCNHSIHACINEKSLFFKKYKNEIEKVKAKNKIILIKYSNNALTSIICDYKHIILEDGKQMFIKYYTEILGKRISKKLNFN